MTTIDKRATLGDSNPESCARRLRALVVDDEEFLRQIMIRALAKEEFDCRQAGDGDGAMALIRKEEFDIVVTDLRMPNRSGHQLVVDVLGMPQRPAIVMLTGVIDPELAREVIGLGIDDIVFKPVDYPTFAAKLRAIAERRQQLRDAPPGIKDHRTDCAHGQSVLSGAALELLELVQSTGSNTRDLANAIRNDSTLTATVLNQAKGSKYGHSSRPVSIEQAVARIGRVNVAGLVRKHYSAGSAVSRPASEVDALVH